MQTEQEIIKDLDKLKEELDLKECNLMPVDLQLSHHAKIDALHRVLGHHPPWVSGKPQRQAIAIPFWKAGKKKK